MKLTISAINFGKIIICQFGNWPNLCFWLASPARGFLIWILASFTSQGISICILLVGYMELNQPNKSNYDFDTLVIWWSRSLHKFRVLPVNVWVLHILKGFLQKMNVFDMGRESIQKGMDYTVDHTIPTSSDKVLLILKIWFLTKWAIFTRRSDALLSLSLQ